ncbi:MAG: isocitrate/isopropylmalate family dehydrogenase, partial [Anaerovoracaceae bacterium]
MNYKIAVIPGDGIGPEVTAEAVKALDAAGKKFGHEFDYTYLLAGGAAIDQYGRCLPEETVETAKKADAVLLGAVGGPKWDDLPGDQRPEKALLGLRKELGLFANLRPAIMFDELKAACPLKEEKVRGGLDLLVVRELTGGIYFGERGVKDTENMGKAAYDVELY